MRRSKRILWAVVARHCSAYTDSNNTLHGGTLMPETEVTVGFKAHLGWLAAVTVAARASAPQPLDAVRLDLFADQPREVREPYHVAGGWDGLTQVAKPDDPAAVVKRAAAQQVRHTASAFERFRGELEHAGLQWRSAVLLIGRGIVHDLEETLQSHAHIHIAEGEAVRAATRAALTKIGVPYVEQDEKSALAGAADKLSTSAEALEAQLKQARPPNVRSWTKEHRTIAAAAWLAQS